MTAAEALVRVENSVEAADAAHYAIDYESDLEAISVLRAAVEERDKLKGEVEELKRKVFKLEVNDLRFYRGKAEAMQLRAEKSESEVERLLKQLTQETDESDMWRTKAEKAETELERIKNGQR